MKFHRVVPALVGLAALWLIAACGVTTDSAAGPTAVPVAETSTPLPDSTPTPQPAPTTPPTATPQPAPTPQPTPTATPQPGPTVQPTVTPQRPPTATSQPAPSPTAAPRPLDPPATHRALLGQPISLPGGESLTITSVREDSRCPPNANCVWEGELDVIAVWISADTVATTLDLRWAYHADLTPSPDAKYLVGIWDVHATDDGLVADIEVRPTTR